MKYFLIFFSLIGCFLLNPINSYAELYLMTKIKDTDGDNEVSFSLMKNKTPKECVDKIKSFDKTIEGMKSLTDEEKELFKKAELRCFESHIVFSELMKNRQSVFLIRFVGGAPILTEFASMGLCEDRQKLYNATSGRSSFCAHSGQKILYQ